MLLKLKSKSIVSLFVGASIMMGCAPGASKKPNFEMLPSLSMMDQGSLKAQKEEEFFPNGSAMRTPPEGTVPRGWQIYPYQKSDAAGDVGKNLINPLPRSSAVLARGRYIYNTTCIVCHGPRGKGDGSVIPKYPTPPSLHSEKVRGWPDGAIYHVITVGQNLMPSYASQIEPMDRWAIVHYIRALQKAVQPQLSAP